MIKLLRVLINTMEQIIAIDKEVFLTLNRLGNPTWDWFWQLITNRAAWTPLYILFAWLVYKEWGWKRLLIVLILVGLMIIFTDQLTNFLKKNVQRLRPCHDESLFAYMRFANCGKSGRFGFTSAHASNHFAVAVFVGVILRHKFKWLLPALLVWAGFIAYSRIYVGVHFPLDIICGSVIGIVFALIFLGIYRYIVSRFDNPINPS